MIFFDSTGKEDIQKMKKMILVTSPPACGKTYISKQLAKELKHVVYLDKTQSFRCRTAFSKRADRKSTAVLISSRRISAIMNMK